MIEGPILYSIMTALFTGGIAFGGVKTALNGTRKRLSNLENQEDENARAHSLIGERLAKVETKIDLIYDRVK